MIKKARRKIYQELREKDCQNSKRMWKTSKTALHKSLPPQICISSLKKPDRGLKNNLKRKIKLLKQMFFSTPFEANLDNHDLFIYPMPLKIRIILLEEIH